MPPLFETFVPCRACGVHAKQHETHCPHCGEAMARSGPKRALTVAATLAGLSLAVTGVGGATGCGDDTTTSSSASSSDDDGTGGMNVGSAYGVGPTTGPGGSGGAGGVAASGQGGMNVGSAYGVGPTTGAGGGGGQ